MMQSLLWIFSVKIHLPNHNLGNHGSHRRSFTQGGTRLVIIAAARSLLLHGVHTAYTSWASFFVSMNECCSCRGENHVDPRRNSRACLPGYSEM